MLHTNSSQCSFEDQRLFPSLVMCVLLCTITTTIVVPLRNMMNEEEGGSLSFIVGYGLAGPILGAIQDKFGYSISFLVPSTFAILCIFWWMIAGDTISSFYYCNLLTGLCYST